MFLVLRSTYTANPKGNKARRTLRPQGIVQAPNTTEDHYKVALHRSINRSQPHTYGLLDFTLFEQHKPLMFYVFYLC